MSERPLIAGIVLAGGRSTRFGSDKALAKLAGSTLLDHCVSRLSPQVSQLLISGRFAPVCPPDTPVLADPINDRGPLGGILAGLEWMAEREETHLVSVAVDTPFFPYDLVERLRDHASGDAPAITSQNKRLHPALALWPKALLKELRAAIASEPMSLRHFALELCNASVVDFDDAPQHAFFNINQPRDLLEAERIYSNQSSQNSL